MQTKIEKFNIEQHLRTHTVKREDIFQVCRICPERPYVELQVPENSRSIHRVDFTITSHDQGRSQHCCFEVNLTKMLQVGPITDLHQIHTNTPSPGSVCSSRKRHCVSIQSPTSRRFSAILELLGTSEHTEYLGT